MLLNAEHLPAAVQSELRNLHRIQTYQKGSLILHLEEPSEHFYVLRSGHIRLYQVSEDVREVTLTVVRPGELFGEIALTTNNISPYYAETLDECQVEIYTASGLRNLLRTSQEFAFHLSCLMYKQLTVINQKYTSQVFSHVDQRLAGVLLYLAETSPEGVKRIKGRTSHQDLAFMAGSTRETVTKLLGEFENKRLVALSYRQIDLIDEEGLEKLSREGK